jgi:hypothetical protein
VTAAGLGWTIHLVVSPSPWAADSALAIALGTLIFSIAALATLLLGRGQWTRLFAIGLLIVELGITLVGDFEPWLITALALTGLALTGLLGPWWKGWLRERPAAGAPGIEPILLTIGAFALVPLVGLAAPSGLRLAHGILGAAGVLLSWGYMKGGKWALLGMRFGLPALILLGAVFSPIGGALLLLAGGSGITYLAWTQSARLAVDPAPQLPAPRKKRK